MNRRQFLSLSISALSVSLVGCTEGGLEDGDETETQSPEDTEPDCGQSSMCEGTQIIEVHVYSGFSGAAVLGVGCRDEEVTIQSGESVQITREEDAEGCGVTLHIDDEKVYGEYIEGHVSVTVTVDSSGEIDEERVML